MSLHFFLWALRVSFCEVIDLTCGGRRKVWECWKASSVASPIVLDRSCVGALKHECRSSMLCCIPHVAPRNVLVVSCVRLANMNAYTELNFAKNTLKYGVSSS